MQSNAACFKLSILLPLSKVFPKENCKIYFGSRSACHRQNTALPSGAAFLILNIRKSLMPLFDG